ncbi:hypothetical protein CDL12_09626 [Handroanthus impetiginosus]|uniref:Uncharacterized protein n=1 Tax=Handroanthus impetiginosus TaxID=429701 RepID=A0A2G9HJL3_9LAMI|nr:hypothetical protein CDL12_09626 [Handroanthus impetiginosus]
MSQNYDNWERLVTAVLRREKDRQLALSHSRDPSTSSDTSSFSYISSSSHFGHDIDRDQFSFVRRQIKSEVPLDYSDLILSHSEWKAMLPPDKHEIVFRSASLGFFLDQRTGKNCFLLGAMKLQLPEGFQDLEGRWERTYHPKSRFSEVIELVYSNRFNIQGDIYAEMLSPETSYAIYAVFGFNESSKIQESTYAMVSFSYDDATKHREVHFQSGNHRADGWMEVEIGSFYVPRSGKNGIITARLELKWENIELDSCLIFEGIEFRPSRGKGIFSNFRMSSKA